MKLSPSLRLPLTSSASPVPSQRPWAAILYVCAWVGGQVTSRNGAFWPATVVVAWIFYSCVGNLVFLATSAAQ